MKRNPTYFLAAGAVLALVVGTWFLSAPPTEMERTAEVNVVEPDGRGVLDGMTFSGFMNSAEEGDPVEDTFIFEKGTFMSAECDRRCGYPARPYFVRNVGEKIEFFSESNCLYKDAKIVWRGTVEGETIKGVSIWTVNRWYWTIEKEIPFRGTLNTSAGSIASSQ